MSTDCKYEFQAKHFGFIDCSPDRFYVSQWGKNRVAFLIYRILIFAYALAWIIADVTVTYQPYYAIFLTNWTEVAGCLYFLLAMILSIYGLASRGSNESELSFFHKIVWIVMSTILSAALMTDLLFWILLSGFRSANFLSSPFNIHEHVINYVLLLTDLFVNDVPMRLLHFIYPVGYGLTYLIFSLILFGADVRRIYPVLDWRNNPGTAALYTLIASFVALPLCHALHFGVYHLRVFIARRCLKHADSQPIDDKTVDAIEMGGGDKNPAFEEE